VRGPLLALDRPLRSAIAGASVRPGPRAEMWYVLADLGSTWCAVPVLAAALAYAAWRGRRWVPPVVCAAAMAAVPLIVVPLKAAIGRGGPGSLALVNGYPGLYPSGHTATAALAYGAAALLLAPSIRRTAARWGLVAGIVVLNLLVGVALVYCGYHWPLDVVGSWLLGGALLSSAARVIVGRPSGSPDSTAGPGTRSVSCSSGSRG
jgi:membrane-associated phospholipid phosphatase